MVMNFKNPFNRFFAKSNRAAESSENTSTDATSDWDSVAAMNPAAESDTSFDDLAAEVPFAGASVTDPSVTPEHVLPDEFPDNDAEQQETSASPELKAIKNFFKIDLRVKRELMQAAPSPADDYDEASRMDYVEEAYRTFRDFRSDFSQINRDFGFGDYIDKQTNAFFQRGAEHFALGSYNSGVTKQIYQNEFTKLRRDFVEKVKDECVGYTLSGNLGSLIAESGSVNELLHAYHSFIMNNEGILQAVPPIATKENSRGYPITLRGETSPLAK